MTRLEARKNAQNALDDIGATFTSVEEANELLQDAYDDIVSQTLCLRDTIVVPFQDGLIYYDLEKETNGRYIGTISCFNNNTNQYLCDYFSVREFEKFREDWELVEGTPQHWAPHSQKTIAIYPHYNTAVGDFVLNYWQNAPVVTSDATEILIPYGSECLLDLYVTIAMLETAHEFTKASTYAAEYIAKIQTAKTTSMELAKASIMRRVR